MSFSKNSAQRTVGNIIRNLKMNGSKFMKQIYCSRKGSFNLKKNANMEKDQVWPWGY